MRVLVTFDPAPGERELVEQRLDDVVWLADGPHREQLAQAEGALSLWPRGEMRRAGIGFSDLPRLRWLKLITAGANHVDWEAMPDVAVMTTPDATSPFIAEYVLGAIIGWARGLSSYTRRIAAGEFPLGERALAVRELRIGIVGYGGLGQAVADEVLARGAQVRAVSRSGVWHPPPGQEPAAAARAPSRPVALETVDALPAMAAWADVLVLCVPLRKETTGLVDARVLAALDHGLLVNVARGPVVDEAALYDWLSSSPGTRAAVLDVWWRYPREGRPFTRPFHELDNVVMTPHNSPNVADFRRRMIDRACEDLQRVQATGRLEHVEDPATQVPDARQ